MKNAIARLAYTRSIEAEYKDEAAAAQAELKETDEWQYLEQRREYLETAKADVADAEVEVYRQARAAYKETSDESPHPAVTVRYVGHPIVIIARDLSGYLPKGE